MLLFGTVTLTPRLMYNIRQKNIPKAIYFFLVWSMSLFLAVASFYYGYLGITK